ncbi:MAG: hypothetical protein ORO03_08870 [Alphaproteobacteria bacterium]|nr:hypothetical protein [Alphaproteobacteria bacterium]
MRHRFLVLLSILWGACCGELQAAEPPLTLRPPPTRMQTATPQPHRKLDNGPKEISISAKQGIEWHRDQKYYLAKTGVVVQRGDSTISGNQIKLFYSQNPQATGSGTGSASASTTFTRIEASGNTVILDRGNRLVGDRAVIYLDSLETIVTGKNLSLTTSNNEVVTASDSLEYRDVTRLAVARGKAKFVKGDQTMTADYLTASLTPKGDLGLQFLAANGFGNVHITSPNRAAAGDRGSFDLRNNFAVLSGNVKLGQGTSLVAGDYGEMDMKTGVGRILVGADAAAAGRQLRAIIVPDDLKNKPSTELVVPRP